MPLSALALVIVAAALHATWHFLVKKTEQRQLFTGWVLAVAAVLYSPILLFFAPVVRSVWPYAVISAIVQGTYFILLVRAYECADFSFAYPIARGSAPALLTLWAILFLGGAPHFDWAPRSRLPFDWIDGRRFRISVTA